MNFITELPEPEDIEQSDEQDISQHGDGGFDRVQLGPVDVSPLDWNFEGLELEFVADQEKLDIEGPSFQVQGFEKFGC